MTEVIQVTVTRDIDRVVNQIWSPTEVFDLEPQCDPLCPMLTPVTVPIHRYNAVRTSTVVAPFESLHATFSPTASHRSSLDDLTAGVITAKKMSFSDLANPPRLESNDPARSTMWFRFVSTFPTRTFTVDRSPAQLLCLLSALQYSFPHLLIPYDTAASEALAALLCDFVQAHAGEMFCYLPVMFFFFELQDKAVVAFFPTLEAQVVKRKTMEATLFDSLKPKVSKGWFSWGSSAKPKDAGAELAEEVATVEAHVSDFPKGFKDMYMASAARMNQVADVAEKTRALRSTLKESSGSLAVVAEGLAAAPPPCDAVLWCFANDAVSKEERDLSADVKRESGVLQQFAFTACALASNGCATAMQEMERAVDTCQVIAASVNKYLKEYIAMKRTVVESAPLVLRLAPLPKGCPAAESPGLLKQVTDANVSYRQMVELWERLLTTEVNRAMSALRLNERQCCVHYYRALEALSGSLNARHHTSLVGDTEKGTSDTRHPLVVALGAPNHKPDDL